jgi:hypothetical protein
MNVEQILSNPLKETSKDITVIVSVYSRPQYFERLIREIDKVKYNSIWISCWNSPNYHLFKKKYEEMKNNTQNKLYFFSSNFQLKYFGRFQLAYQVNTKYTLILDDDCIIQPKFYELCLKMINIPEYNGLLGVKGWIFPEKKENLLGSYGEGKFYYPKPSWKREDETKCAFEIDIVGGAWFFRKEWILYMFREFPYTFETGEDFHFSYMLKKYGNIKTYFIPNNNNYKEYWGCSSDFSTIDMSSNSRSDNAGELRKKIFWKQYLGLCPFVKRIQNKCLKNIFLLFDEQDKQIYLELCKNKEQYIPIVISNNVNIILQENKNLITFYYCNELNNLSYVIKMCEECFMLKETIFYINQQKTKDLPYIKNFNYKLVELTIKFMNDYNLGDGFNKYILRFLLCNENLNFRTPDKNKYLIKSMALNNDIDNILLNILCTGSILPSLCNNDYAFCPGIQYLNKNQIHCDKFNGKFLRGPLSKKYVEESLNINLKDINYFDLGLLLPLLYNPNKSIKKYKLGIIPHHKEKDIFKNINHCDICIIDILCCKTFDYICKNFIDKLCECDMIISSSLHGIIIADAYNIPNIIFKKTNLNYDLDYFKFKDYYSSINRKFDVKDISKYNLKDLSPIVLDNTFLQYIITNYQKINIDYNNILKKMKFIHPEVLNKTSI